MIYISCQFETPIGRSDYSDYVRALQLDVSAYDDVGNRILLGKIAADQVLIGDARSVGMPLFDVCDQDSQGLYEAYEALFDDKSDFQPELNIDEPADSLIFVWRAVLHSRLRPYLPSVIDSIGTLFGNDIRKRLATLGLTRNSDIQDVALVPSVPFAFLMVLDSGFVDSDGCFCHQVHRLLRGQ